MNAVCETFHYTPRSHEHCFCASSINFMCQKPHTSHKTWSLEHFLNSYCCTKEANSGRYSSAQCWISFYLRYQSHKVTHNKLKSIECIWKCISCAAAKPERKKGFHGFVKRSAEKLWCGPTSLKKKSARITLKHLTSLTVFTSGFQPGRLATRGGNFPCAPDPHSSGE